MRRRVSDLCGPAPGRHRGRGMVLALLAGVGGLAACQLIAGIDDRKVYVPDVGTPDTGGEAAVDPCQQPDVPPPPSSLTSSGSDSVVITAALSRIMLGSTDGGPYYGFNLDKTCTCPQAESCTHSGSQQTCDDEGGIDNYARHIFEETNLTSESNLNNAVQTGLSGALIKISDYNGKADDAVVTVTVYGSLGYESYPAAPKWDGTDRWTVDPGSANGPYFTNNAYVAGSKLVASLNFPIIVGSAYTNPVTIELVSGRIVADLQMNGTSLVKMTGLLGGRWDPARFLPSLQHVPDPTLDGGWLCGTDTTYQFVKAVICANTDINADPQFDNQGGQCNAVSMGLGFEASPAVLGNVGPTVDAGAPCGASWTDKCN